MQATNKNLMSPGCAMKKVYGYQAAKSAFSQTTQLPGRLTHWLSIAKSDPISACASAASCNGG